MKALKFIIGFLIILAALYIGAILLGFNLPKPAFLDKSIEGSVELKVTLLMDNNVKSPLPKTEVDLGEKPGRPSKGGIAYTNDSGVATFKVKPGDYYIYFNTLSFPENLAIPEAQKITVVDQAVNEKLILVGSKSK